jgi:hypothetical protein
MKASRSVARNHRDRNEKDLYGSSALFLATGIL